MSSKLSKKELADRIQALCVLVVDDNQYMRKMIRSWSIAASKISTKPATALRRSTLFGPSVRTW
jgi:hypothetical protein